MPESTDTRQVIAVDPDGVPVALRDIAGDTIDGTLWGAVRAGGAFGLIVTERDHLSGETTPPTPGVMRALADAMEDDPADPHVTEGSRLWWKEEAARLQAALYAADERAALLAADVETMQQSVRDYAAEADAARAQVAEAWQLTAEAQRRAEETGRAAVGLRDELARQADRLISLVEQLAEARRELDRERNRTRELRRGQVELVRASLRVEERNLFRRELAERVSAMRQVCAITATAAAGVGYVLGRRR